jgi:hypothetical protein
VAWYDPIFGTDWGGTDYLEQHQEAHQKYLERIEKWSNSPAYAVWDQTEKDTAIADANYIYSITNSAAGYWGSLPAFWESYSGSFVSLDSEQFRKIVDSVGASSDAADTYAANRNPLTHYEPPKIAKNIPWWAYALGGLVIFNAFRR